MEEILIPGENPSPEAAGAIPLVVDLDGTLVKTDLLAESLFALLKHNPLYIFLFPFWLWKGRAFFKKEISRRVALDVSVLPYHPEFLAHLQRERDRGRRLVLATGSDEAIASQVAAHLSLFDMVLASNGVVNLAGRAKRECLAARFGEKRFDYAGNSWRDLTVWSSARKALLVNSSRGLPRRAARVTEIERVFDGRRGALHAYLRALRPGQWLKNLLVFAPLVMAHRFHEPDLLAKASLAFCAFGFCASSVYLLNDLADLPADRRHPHKRLRPFAAGEIPLLWGFGSAPLLLGLAFLMGLALPPPFIGMLAIYFVLNLAYSFALKRVVLLDVLVLAGLYTMRIMAGSAALAIWPSSWLLAFSTFLFLSLALVKRYAELGIMRRVNGETAQVRGYRVIDMELLASLGGGSGYVAVLVLAIYISSGAAGASYTRHMLMWLLCPLLLYWISYVWLTAHRGGMNDDPLVFTVRDRASHIVFLLSAIIILFAR